MYQMLLAERKNEPLSLHPLSILQSCCACRRPCCGAVVRACWALVRCKRRSARCARCITSSLGRPTRQALCLRPRRPLQARPGGALPAAGPASGGALLDARRWQRVRDAAALRAPLAAYATEVWEQALADSPAVRAQLRRTAPGARDQAPAGQPQRRGEAPPIMQLVRLGVAMAVTPGARSPAGP